MNNKGFTLVEILAVFAIMSILAGVAITAVSKYTTKTKEETYRDYEKNLKTAATNYLTTHPEYTYDDSLTLLAQTLIDEGLLDSMTDPVNKDNSCNLNSYVTILGDYADENAYNLNYKYEICLRCKSYTSSDCK